MNEFWNRQRQLVPLFFILLLSTLTGLSQCPTRANETGGFTAPERVCVGDPLTLTGIKPELGTSSRYTYEYKYPGGADIPVGGDVSTTHRYTSPGSYTIFQVGSSTVTSVGTLACRVIEVLPNKPVDFTIKACSNRLVAITITLDADTRRYNSITVRWDAGTPEQTVLPAAGATTVQLTHDYPAIATRRTIIVTGRYDNACAVPNSQTKDMPSSSVGTSAPLIRELRSSASSITLACQSDAGFSVYEKNAAGAYVPTGYSGTTSQSFAIPTTSNQVRCFQLVSTDACAGPASRSAEVCSLAPVVQAEDRKNVVSWPAYAGTEAVTMYRGYKNGVSAPAWGGPVSPYEDNAGIVCGRIYCYEIEATAGPTTIRSAPVCVTGVDNSTVAAPTSAIVSVQNNSVSLQIPATGLPNPYTLVVTRADGTAGNYSPLTTTDQTSYIDNTAQTNSQSYCYQVAVQNNCGVLSKPTNPACTILLTNRNGVLTWTPASPFSGDPPQAYQLIFINPNTGLSDTRTLGTVTSFQPDANSASTDYQITALSASGVSSYSNPLQIDIGLRLALPNAFSPNNDGLNDFFKVAVGFVDAWNTFSMTVFDRWGGVVFNSTDKHTTGWNGEVNGAPAVSGYYSYKIQLTDQAGKPFERTGQVLLIR